ncbi:MAG TPA: ATP-binding protein [Caproiciproducens sp.]|nr:ATP-binding protein [Caproiciproducens sp.]
MKRLKGTESLLILGMLFVIVISHLPVVYTLFYHDLTGIPAAEDGSVSLCGISPGRSIVLDGKWKFYWNRLIVTEPEQNSAPDFLIRVPDYWSRYKLNGSYLPAGGFASYRLTLEGLEAVRPVTVYLPDFGSAYRVFLDGKLTAESGTMSAAASEIFTTTGVKLYPQTLSAGLEHEVVIEAATTRFSGLYMAPVLRDYDSAIQEDGSRNSLRLILFGTALFSFFVLIAGYILSFRTNRHSLWLPAMGLFVLLRIMITTEFYSFWQDTVFFHLSYEATNPLMFFLSFAFKYLLIFLIEELLGIAFSRKEKLGLLIYYVVLYLLYFFIPRGFYNRYLSILLPVCAFVVEVYAFFKVYHNRRRMKKYGLLVYWGAVLAITGLIIDCYYINGNIYPNLSLSLLLLFSGYLMILSLVSTIQAADVYRDFAVSSARLAQARAQIAMQTEYYDVLSAQMNEVRSVRHDVRHFIGVLKRLSDEGKYEELNRFLSEYAEKAVPSPLPVFCENVVANSILGYYFLRFKECGIPFHCACYIPKQLSVSDSDLCVVLGNALENAMEACGKLENPEARFVSAEARTVNGQLLIKIANAYNGLLNQRDGHYISTKSGGLHGIGLQSIKKVVGAYKGFVKMEHSQTVFTLMAAFPDPLAEAPPAGASR